jgi:hypothetical protein
MGQETSLEGASAEEIQALAMLAKSVRDNPATRRQFLSAVKTANPNINIPELDLETAQNAAFGARDKEIADLRAQLQQQEQQNSAKHRIDALKEEGVIRSANEFNDVVKYAAENGFQTTDAGLKRAAEARRREIEAATPTPTFAVQRPALGNKELMKNPQAWAREEAGKAIEDLKKQRR